MSDRADWTWMPHAAHLIVGHDCRFHLATEVGGYIVSTVGEYLPDSQVREILADSRKIRLEGKGDARLADWMKKCGYEELGYDRTYETMVFHSKPEDGTDGACCPFRMRDGNELELRGYKDAATATAGHMAMCEKWSQREG